MTEQPTTEELIELAKDVRADRGADDAARREAWLAERAAEEAAAKDRAAARRRVRVAAAKGIAPDPADVQLAFGAEEGA